MRVLGAQCHHVEFCTVGVAHTLDQCLTMVYVEPCEKMSPAVGHHLGNRHSAPLLFFESGKDHVNHILDVFNWLSNEQCNFKTVLDFGCGTGRLILPFSAIAQKVTGVDVSPSMLREAEKHLKSLNIDNVELIQSNSLEVLSDRKFDLVHTYIVLQHIPVSAGYRLIKSLLKAVAPGGYAMIHFTYSNSTSAFKKLKYYLRSKYKFFSQVSNIMNGRPTNTPDMQMNNYNLSRVLRMVEEAGFKKFFVELTNHGGFRGVCLYLQNEL